MHRRLFGRISAAAALVALAVPVSLIAASPSQAGSTCTQSFAPNLAGGQSGLTVGCISDAADGKDKISIADTTNAAWHRGAARTVTGTAASGSATLTVLLATPLTSADVGRPISGHAGIKGGTFIKTFVSATSATLSQTTSAAVPGGTALKIEHTRSRVLVDAACSTANANLTSTSAVFAATDVGKSVSGGPYGRGARIVTFTSATSVVVDDNASAAGNNPPSAACITVGVPGNGADMISIGATTYSPATSATTVYTETYNRQIALGAAPSGTAGVDGGACAGSTITLNSGGGGTNAGDVGLPVFFKNATGGNIAGTWKVSSVGASTIVLSAACGAAASDAVIGLPGANAPSDGRQMARLKGQLNLSDTLVKTGDNCTKNTYEGFGVVGIWNNPGSYIIAATLGSPLPHSQAQIQFPTAVLNFAGYITNATTNLFSGAAGTLHNRFVFPSLPTSLSVCSGAGVTTTKVGVTLDFDPTVLATSPPLPTGAGNPSAPSVRALGPATGAQGVLVRLTKTSTGANTDVTPVTCTVLAATGPPTNLCGI